MFLKHSSRHILVEHCPESRSEFEDIIIEEENWFNQQTKKLIMGITRVVLVHQILQYQHKILHECELVC